MKVKYYTEFNLPPVIPSVSGTGKQKHYALDPLKNEVIQDGEDDFQMLIDAARDSVDVHKILAKFHQTNDETLLQIRSTISGDMTVFPGSVLEAQEKLRELSVIYSENDELRGLFKDFADFAKRGTDPTAWHVAGDWHNPEQSDSPPEKKEGEAK